MNKFTIQQLQQMRESEDRVEFKAGEGGNVSYDGRGKTNPKDRRRCILGYVIALCNEGGGRLVIGMHDNYPHRVTGTRQAQDAIGQLEADIYRDTTIRPEIYELYDEEEHRVKPMSDAVYLKILQESEPDFSEKICEGLSLEDLDEEAIRVMKKKYADRWEKPEFNNIPTNQVLKDFMLMDNDGHLNYAALILLAKSEVIYRYLPCDNVVVEYRLYHHMIEYTARAEFREPLFLLVDHVWDYINQPASNPLQHYRDKFARYALPAFNEDVVREAVLNAICHRVMFIQSDIVIKQYPDMLVITNAGGFPVGVDTDNILSVNSMPRSRRISEVLQKTGLVEKSGQGVDRMFAISISEGKPIPDYSLTDEWQVCLRLHGTIQDPALLLLIHDIQRNRATTEQLNAFDLLALYKVSRGESIRNVDSVTLKKLLSQELLIETSDGIKLTPLYDEMKLRAGVTDKIEDKNVPVNDTVNVQLNDTVKLSQLTERQRKIYEAIKSGTVNDTINGTINAQILSEALGASVITIKRDLYVLRDLNLIKYVGSNKTGHWEAVNQ